MTNTETRSAEDAAQERETRGMRDRRVHMANERTFLAWVRTSIAIMAFGFVVEKFSLFVRQMASFLGKESVLPAPGWAPVVGVLLVGLGVVIGVLAFLRYKHVERQIETDTYQPTPLLSGLLFLAVFATGIFLILYLIHSM